MTSYFQHELPNGTSLRLYEDPLRKGDLRLETTIGGTSVRAALDENLADRLGTALVNWYLTKHYEHSYIDPALLREDEVITTLYEDLPPKEAWPVWACEERTTTRATGPGTSPSAPRP